MLPSICLSASSPLYSGRASRGVEVKGDDLWIVFQDLCYDGMAHRLRLRSPGVDTVDAKDPEPLDFQCEFHRAKGCYRGSGWPSGLDRSYARRIPAQA